MDSKSFSPEKSKTPTKLNQQNPFKGEGIGIGNSNTHYTKAEVLLNGYDEHTLKELHMRLNGVFSRIKKQSKIKETKDKDLSEMGKFVWSTPSFLLIYLVNTIRAKSPKPLYGENPSKPIDFVPNTEDLNYKIQPWVKFKQLLFDIYDHRIEHAWEINGAINNTYVALEEHLVLFFLEKHRDKNRAQIELQIIEFLATLKYYSEYWKRARQFAVLYGLMKGDDSFLVARRSGGSDTRFPPKLNDGKIGETESAHTDIFLQEFFF